MQEEVAFFSYNKKSDWEKGIAANLQISDAGLRLAQVERFGWRQTISLARLEGPGKLRQLSLGEADKLLLLDEAANLWQFDQETNHLDQLFGNDHQLFTAAAKIEAVPGTLFVADSTHERKLAGYLASNGQLVWSLHEWKGQPILPLAVTTDREQHLYVLFPFGQTLAIMKINSYGEVVFVFQPEGVEGEAAPGQERTFYLSVSSDGSIYLLDAGRSMVTVYDRQGALQTQFSLILPAPPSGFGLDAAGALYVGDSRGGEPLGEDPRFVLQYAPDGSFVGTVAGYRGKTDELLLDVKTNRMYIWNLAEYQITVLQMTSRTKQWDKAGYNGLLLLTALDSTDTETIWHKITLDADFPDETQVRISYYASDSPEFRVGGQMRPLDLYLLDPKITLDDKAAELERLWSKPIVNPRDALLIKAQGRYLWLKIELNGSEKFSPFIRSLRSYFPRTSYLNYLPGVYQEDEQSRNFLERYFSLFGTFMSEMEEKITRISRYFDADSVSGEYLRWLSTWLAIAADDNWTEEQTRLLLKRAPTLYQMRGTRQGLAELLEIFTGDKPFIVEFFQYKNLIEKAEIKEYMAQLYGLDPYSFCVLIKPDCIKSEQQRLLVQRILDAEKPAFADSKLVVLEKWMYMGTHSYIGVNTFLSEPSLLVLDNKATMPYHTVLIDVDRDNRIGLHTRLELDSELE